MAVVSVYDQEKNVVGEVNLPEEIFSVPAKPEILNLVVKSQLASGRLGTVSVKTRSTIRGGGRKPWRQKGTGRARAGTVRSPLWTGGAVTHGPKPRSYELKVNRKVKRLALKMALSSKQGDDNLYVVQSIELDRPKTRDFAAIQSNFDWRKALIVVPEKERNLELATRNIPGVKLIKPEQLNVYELLKYHQLVLTPAVVEHLKERLQ